jgi:hypothetical protein
MSESSPSEKSSRSLPVIGWREWVSLEQFGIPTIKAKVDSGARSSSLHVFELDEFEREGQKWARFKVHPIQKNSEVEVEVEAPILEHRSVRSSSGKAQVRPVVQTTISMMGQSWPIEITLASRDKMKFRMLLGRQAFRGRFLLDAGVSFCGGRPQRKSRKKKA